MTLYRISSHLPACRYRRKSPIFQRPKLLAHTGTSLIPAPYFFTFYGNPGNCQDAGHASESHLRKCVSDRRAVIGPLCVLCIQCTGMTQVLWSVSDHSVFWAGSHRIIGYVTAW